MKTQNSTIQQKWLRFLLPFPIGVVIYILILLVFDSLDKLSSNFFSQEVAFTILLTFILLKTQRLLFKYIDKHFPLQLHSIQTDDNSSKSSHQSRRIILFPLLSLLFSVIVVGVIVSVYFSFVLRIKDFSSELIVFNGVYGVVAILYGVIHVSTSFLAVHKQVHYQQEKELRKGLETDLEKFKMQINPQLLYDGLEDLISIVHANPKVAEQFVNHLSKIYRYNLDNRHVELVDVKQELELCNSLLHLLNIKYNNTIHFNCHLPDQLYLQQIIPCTLSTLIQECVKRSIVNAYQPIQLELTNVGNELVFICNDNPKIGLNGDSWNLAFINKAYSFFNDKQLEITQNNQQISISIPLFEIEEE